MRYSRLIISVVIGLVGLLLFYLLFLHYTEPTEIGIMRNWATGETTRDHPGWNISAPWVKVAKIDMRPTRVCVTSASKARNCLLVQFNPDAIDEFLEVEGFYYYWWANRISFNLGYDEEYRGFKDLLRGYAYSSKKYSFVKVLEN